MVYECTINLANEDLGLLSEQGLLEQKLSERGFLTPDFVYVAFHPLLLGVVAREGSPRNADLEIPNCCYVFDESESFDGTIRTSESEDVNLVDVMTSKSNSDAQGAFAIYDKRKLVYDFRRDSYSFKNNAGKLNAIQGVVEVVRPLF
ncbi:hypothetical protein HN587_01145 [Candidatus Woesearchaeota archaeon]|nr:hypothetical protein [Candidatus Woesearchaeota archaeon]